MAAGIGWNSRSRTRCTSRRFDDRKCCRARSLCSDGRQSGLFPPQESHRRGAASCLGTGEALTLAAYSLGFSLYLTSWSPVDDGIESPTEARTSVHTCARWWRERRHHFGTQFPSQTLGLGDLRDKRGEP